MEPTTETRDRPDHTARGPGGRHLRRELVRGAATMAPLLLGYLPFALLIGLAAGRSENPLAAWAGSLLIFAGSAHLSVIELVDGGSGLAAVVCTALLINARLTIYSASLAPVWRGARRRSRLLAAAFVIDPMWLVTDRRRLQPGEPSEVRAFFWGAVAVLATGWSSMIGVGVVLGAQRGATDLIGACTPLFLSTIVAPHLRTAAGARCVCAAGAVAVATASWPAGTGLLLAMAAGAVGGGAGTSRRRTDRP